MQFDKFNWGSSKNHLTCISELLSHCSLFAGHIDAGRRIEQQIVVIRKSPVYWHKPEEIVVA